MKVCIVYGSNFLCRACDLVLDLCGDENKTHYTCQKSNPGHKLVTLENEPRSLWQAKNLNVNLKVILNEGNFKF